MTNLLFVTFVYLTLAVIDATEPDANCLKCICKVETNAYNCQRNDYCEDNIFGIEVMSCGPLSISMKYFNDCNVAGTFGQQNSTADYIRCANNANCATQCVKEYTSRFVHRCNLHGAPTCKKFAQIHYDGPHSCLNRPKSAKVKKVMRCYRQLNSDENED